MILISQNQPDMKALSISKENVSKNGYQLNEKNFFADMSRVSKKYDFIYANIELNTLKNYMQLFVKLLVTEGCLVLSGILKTQKIDLLDKYTNIESSRFKVIEETERNDWVCLELKKIGINL